MEFAAAAKFLGDCAAAFSGRSDLGHSDVLAPVVSHHSPAGMDLKQIALFAWLPFLAADIGCIFGGTFSMWLQKYWRVSLINARRAAFTLGAFTMLGVGFVGFVESPYTAIALLSLAGFAHQTLSVTVITMASDLFKKNEVATVAGMAGTFGNAGLLIFSLLIGALVLKIGYAPFFICLGLLDLIGAAVLWTVVKERTQQSEIGQVS